MQTREHLLHHETAAYEPQYHNHLYSIGPKLPFCFPDVIIRGPPYTNDLPSSESQNNTVNRYIYIQTVQSADQELVRIFVKKKLKNNTHCYIIDPVTYSKRIFSLPMLSEIISAFIFCLIKGMGVFVIHVQISGNFLFAFLPHNCINLPSITSSFQLHLQHLAVLCRKAAPSTTFIPYACKTYAHKY